jgi:hypothetical protein
MSSHVFWMSFSRNLRKVSFRCLLRIEIVELSFSCLLSASKVRTVFCVSYNCVQATKRGTQIQFKAVTVRLIRHSQSQCSSDSQADGWSYLDSNLNSFGICWADSMVTVRAVTVYEICRQVLLCCNQHEQYRDRFKFKQIIVTTRIACTTLADVSLRAMFVRGIYYRFTEQNA